MRLNVLVSNTKKVTSEIERGLADKAKALATKRGQNLGEFHTSLYRSALSADKFLEAMKLEAV